MGMFDMTMSEEQLSQFRRQLADAVKDQVNGEELVAAGAFRRGLPQQVLLAVTPDRVYAFNCKVGRKGYTAGDEVAFWQRAGLRFNVEKKMGLTKLTIESPAEGEKATTVPIGVKDDAVSVEVINLLVGSGSGAPAV